MDLLFDDPYVARYLDTPISVLEPFAGRSRALADRAADFGHQVITADVDAGAVVDVHCDSFVESFEPVDAVITNPPYTVMTYRGKRTAADAVRKFVPLSTQFAAFVMRLSWLEPCGDRVDILEQYPPDRVIVLPRYSFKRGAVSNKDMMTVAWFIWTAQRIPGRSTWRTATPKELQRYELKWNVEKRRSL